MYLLTMKCVNVLLPSLLIWILTVGPVAAAESKLLSPVDILKSTLSRVADIIEPKPGDEAQTFSARLRLVKADGIADSLIGSSADLAYQAPNRLRVAIQFDDKAFKAGRNGQELWVYSAAKNFGVIGVPGFAKFLNTPDKKDATRLDDFRLPISREKLALLPLLMEVRQIPNETVGQSICYVLEVAAKPEATEVLKLPQGRLRLLVRTNDFSPLRAAYSDDGKVDVVIAFENIELEKARPETSWQIPAKLGDHIEKAALGHLVRFLDVAVSMLNRKIPTLGPPNEAREIVAVEGQGRLEDIDGTRVLFLKGTPEEMGRQQGTLLRREARRVTNRMLYGIGVGSSFEKGRWFFGEISEAERRLEPFMDPRYLREMDALALAAGLETEEVRLANYFPELFHCSGFALYGQATQNGALYHGRILDYLRGVGLEENAVVMVFQPDQGNAWVNVGYAGFIGSVTAMNEKHVAIGEMGGRGEGSWDGKPMAQLMREVMEKAATIDQAVDIMRRGPRTCEYYYVISDAKSQRAVGIAATPDKFETIWAGESHPQLPHAIDDVVLMSAGGRYEELARRVKALYGQFNAASARDLMTRPVCMNSNIQSVLFDPGTLDFWVANADSKNVASHTRYTQYNLRELLKSANEPAAAQ